MADDVLTLREAADVLGVHYMTAYRYVRIGQLDAVKVGGEWRITTAALDAFRSGASPAPVRPGARAPWAERLESRLIDGDSVGAWAVIDKAMGSGLAIDRVYLDVISPALVGIGERWSNGELDIAIEHRASNMVMRIIGRLGTQVARRGRRRGVLVVASPAGELHSLPLAILGDLLRLEGWEVSDLGPDLPPDALVRRLHATPDVVAVGLSASAAGNLGSLVASCSAVRAAFPDLFVVLGGGAVHGAPHALELGGHGWAASGAEMSALVSDHLAGRHDT